MAVARDGIGVSRRELLRRSLGAGVFLVLAEWIAGTLGFLWPQTAIAGLRVRVGTLADIEAANPSLPVADGFPAYVAVAKAFVVLVEPGDGFRPGSDATGTGAGVMEPLLRLYPTRWQRRYASEMDALLADDPPGIRA